MLKFCLRLAKSGAVFQKQHHFLSVLDLIAFNKALFNQPPHFIVDGFLIRTGGKSMNYGV